MCLIAFAIGATPEKPLLIASNRDEFYDRPTAPLARWNAAHDVPVWAGRDLQDGGTWLGVTPTGRVAMLTNVRSASAAAARHSRGRLPLQWLQGDLSWAELVAGINAADYAGFNLVVGDFHRAQWGWISNRSPLAPHDESQVGLHQRLLGPGVYGLSNATLDTPWPKTRRLVDTLRTALGQEAPTAEASLKKALADPTIAAAHELPATGLPTAAEAALSRAFVHMPERRYGTRSSTLISVERGAPAVTGWRVQIDEWTHPAPPVSEPHGWSADHRMSATLHW
jgi:uncharacterized protein with NRDE domain